MQHCLADWLAGEKRAERGENIGSAGLTGLRGRPYARFLGNWPASFRRDESTAAAAEEEEFILLFFAITILDQTEPAAEICLLASS